MKFQITLDRDKDGIWIAESPSIPGCVSQGKTKAKAFVNIEEAISICLQVRAEQHFPFDSRNPTNGGRCVMAVLPLLNGRE